MLVALAATAVLTAGGLLGPSPCPCCSACNSLLPTAADPDEDGAAVTGAAGPGSFAGTAPAPRVLSNSSRARRCLSSSLRPLADDAETGARAPAEVDCVVLLVAMEENHHQQQEGKIT